MVTSPESEAVRQRHSLGHSLQVLPWALPPGDSSTGRCTIRSGHQPDGSTTTSPPPLSRGVRGTVIGACQDYDSTLSRPRSDITRSEAEERDRWIGIANT